jgi:BolA family transcriptional regulator, general stress-responsive regulator
MSTRALIEQRITTALGPCAIVAVDDQSAAHAGHAGARQSGGGHYAVLIVTSAFEGLSPLQRQRRVYTALAEEMKGRIHALSMRCLTPAEHAAEG